MNMTEFELYRNTPLMDFQNTILFKDNAERDDFFMNRMTIEYRTIKFNQPFNFIKDRSSINVPYPYHLMNGVNYAMFKTEGDPTRYYAHVGSVEYVNNKVSRVNLLIDPVMTYTQGQVLQFIQPVNIQRESLWLIDYELNLNEIRNNDDVIKTQTKYYFSEESVIFDEFIVLLESSVDLSADFGTEDDPRIKTSTGTTADGISSPLEIYHVLGSYFKEFMQYMTDYPWIVQNITQAIMIPRDFIDEENLEFFDVNNQTTLQGVRRFKNGVLKSDLDDIKSQITDELNKTPEQLYRMYGLDREQEAHLLRNEYGTAEVYTFSGDSLYLDLGKLSTMTGLDFEVNMVSGFTNELRIYPRDYNIGEVMDVKPEDYSEKLGGNLNNSIGLKGFDNVPMVIDNYLQGMASSANQRQLNDDRLVTSRFGRVFSNETSLVEKAADVFSMVSNISLSGIANKVNDSYEYYRDLKAQEMDLALSGNSITSQTYENSFLIANGKYGFHLKFSKPSKREMDRIKKYYKLFGFEGNNDYKSPSSVTSNTIANYLQFTGSWHLRNVPPALMDILKLRLEMGVRLWHYNGLDNPMEQDIMDNRMK